MQKTAAGYRERLSPSLWILASAAVVGPMTALILAPLQPTVALLIGAGASVVVILLLIGLSSVVEVSDGRLRAGRAWIEARHLGEPRVALGEQARQERGTLLGPRTWHLIRGGIPGVVVVPVHDPDDPITSWVISSRTPDRLARAIDRARGRD